MEKKPITAGLSLFFLSIIFFFFTTPLHYSPIFETHFKNSIPTSFLKNATQREYLEVTHPLFSDFLQPTCTTLLLNHSFADTIGKPPVSTNYSRPNDCNWSHAVLEFTASSEGKQYDRIVGIWLEGVELLRTSTAEPTGNEVFWKIRKDVTRYSSLLSKSNLTLTVMLENVVNDVYTGIYDVNVSILYYFMTPGDIPVSAPSPAPVLTPFPMLIPVPVPASETQPSKPVTATQPSESSHHIKLNRKFGFEIESDDLKKNSMVLSPKANHSLHYYNEQNVYKSPADLIIPISGNGTDEGIWSKITNESVVNSQGIIIPNNTYKAVLEVYVSFHGDDEFWYSNPPDSYIESNNLTTCKGNGAYREVLVTIDGNLVGSVFPFPVIYTGGINPLFWEPVVAIGAFNLPSYDFSLTPFLGKILDGKEHLFGLEVGGSIQYWLVDANLHLWLDQRFSQVQAGSIDYQPSSLEIKRKSKFKNLDGKFEVEANRKSEYAGWVNSSTGNLTTYITQKFKFKNKIKFENNGTEKSVKQKIKAEIEIRVEVEGMVISQSTMKIKYPLEVSISNQPWKEDNTTLMITSTDHGFEAKIKGDDEFSLSIDNEQSSSGWMIVKDHEVLSGSADTHQEYDLKSYLGCYSRKIDASNGWILTDDTSYSCSSSSSF